MSTLSPNFITDAITSAALAVSDRRVELEQQIADDARSATEQAEAYAKHLAVDGDPTSGFDAYAMRYRDQLLVSPRGALGKVYELWNTQRGGKHNVPPFDAARWRVAEALTDEIGQAVPYAFLIAIYRGGSRYGGSPNDITTAARDVEKHSEGKLVARRTKVGGKVAYLIRERRDDDPESTNRGALPEE